MKTIKIKGITYKLVKISKKVRSRKKRKYCDICGWWIINRYKNDNGYRYAVDRKGFDHDHNSAGSIDLGVCA